MGTPDRLQERARKVVMRETARTPFQVSDDVRALALGQCAIEEQPKPADHFLARQRPCHGVVLRTEAVSGAMGGAFVFDKDGAATKAFSVPHTSYVVVLDASGKVVYTGVGAEQDINAAARQGLAGSMRMKPAMHR